jgi:chemotaxis response regulator CheB
VYRAGLIGVILSSVKQDGTQCLKPIKECGGLAIVQNPATSFIDSMHIRHGRGCG